MDQLVFFDKGGFLKYYQLPNGRAALMSSYYCSYYPLFWRWCYCLLGNWRGLITLRPLKNNKSPFLSLKFLLFSRHCHHRHHYYHHHRQNPMTNTTCPTKSKTVAVALTWSQMRWDFLCKFCRVPCHCQHFSLFVIILVVEGRVLLCSMMIVVNVMTINPVVSSWHQLIQKNVYWHCKVSLHTVYASVSICSLSWLERNMRESA